MKPPRFVGIEYKYPQVQLILLVETHRHMEMRTLISVPIGGLFMLCTLPLKSPLDTTITPLPLHSKLHTVP
jgi:hypothetical protein